MTMPTQGRLAGIDFGTVRIGVAVSDPSQTIASPYENYRRRNAQLDAAHFVELVREEDLAGFVVGLPLHVSGDESPKSMEARNFGAWLTKITALPVAYWDERYTSADAEQHLLGAGLSRKRRRERLDMLAAQIILASYLEGGRA